MPKPTPVKKKPTAAAPAAEPAKVHFPKYAVFVMRGEKSLTVEKAKEYLGWQEITESKGSMLTDFLGNRILLTHNQRGRKIRETWCGTLAQMILAAPPGNPACQWMFNNQPMIAGEYGNILSGRHRMIALIFAEQMRTHPQHREYYESLGWKSPVTIETLLIEGAKEDSKVTRTIDDTMPMTDADVLFCDPQFFKKTVQETRDRLCSVAGKAIRVLWDRTGRGNDAHAKVCTPTELVEFLLAHPTLEDSVTTIEDRNTGGKLAPYLSTGTATALLYLMGASYADPDAYAEERGEKVLDMDHKILTGEKSATGKDLSETVYERACDFWTALSNTTDRVSAVSRFIDNRREFLAEKGQNEITNDERIAVVVKAWNRFLTLPPAKKLTLDDVTPSYARDPDDEDVLHLEEYGKVGAVVNRVHLGIDRGSSKKKDQLGMTSPEPEADDPQPDEVSTAANKIRDEHVNGNGGAHGDDETPEQERLRREAVEKSSTNGKPTAPAKPAIAKKPRSLSPEEHNRAVVGRKPAAAK